MFLLISALAALCLVFFTLGRLYEMAREKEQIVIHLPALNKVLDFFGM